MEKTEYFLDKEAAELFKKLEGIDTNFAKDRLGESLKEIRKREDQRQVLLVELAHQLSAYLADVEMYKDSIIEEEAIRQIDETLDHLVQITPRIRKILIRYCGSPDESNEAAKNDYELIYGNTRVGAGDVTEMLQHGGSGRIGMPDQLNQAFNVFSDHDIFSLYIRIPGDSPKQKDRLHNTFRALARYQNAVKKKSEIVFSNDEGREVSFSPVLNEDGLPDMTLTLLAVANGMKPQTITRLVDSLTKSSLLNRYLSVYNTIFSMEKLKKKLVRPPIEVNNILWLMSDRENETLSEEKTEVAQFAIKNAGGSPQNAARVLKCVYGNDYEKIDSRNLDERLHLSSDLLVSIEKETENQRMEKEILGSIRPRLGEVRGQVYDDLFSQKRADQTASSGKLGVLAKLHKKLRNMVVFYKLRNDIKSKMRGIVYRAINFNLQDFKILAKEFDVSVEEAQNLIELLKECFDDNGRFIKGTFARILPEFSRYERKIFEFLWHYLREYIHQKDRASYLNSLQLLIAKIQNPKKAVKILLSDFCQNPKSITYSDSKALMLCSILIRKYNKELINIEITPEDVLQVSEGVDAGVANYAARVIDRDQKNLIEKIQNIRKRLIRAINPDTQKASPPPLSFLFFLERETYIFFSLVGGTTARTIVLSALNDYGDPQSVLYQGKETEKNLGLLLQNLRILIRGLGRIGETEDLTALDDLKKNLDGLAALSDSDRSKLRVQRLSDWIEASKDQIVRRA